MYDAGLPTQAIEMMFKTIEIIRRFALRERIVSDWPRPVLYSNVHEAFEDTIKPVYLSTPGFNKAQFPHRGWALFDSGHNFCCDEWAKMDRSVIICNRLGGERPLTNVLLHELGHHHLFQRKNVSYMDQFKHGIAIDRAVNALAFVWRQDLNNLTRPYDRSDVYAILDAAMRDRFTKHTTQA